MSCENTRILFSNNVHWQVPDSIATQLGYQRTVDLGNYLGIPMHLQRVSSKSFSFITKKVDQPLGNWKAKNLSLAGRVTLTKFVIQALPTYAMQSYYISASVCDEIDKRCCIFIWEDSNDSRKVHWMSWKALCSPKKSGGLGLRLLSHMNKSLLMKST